MSNMDKNIHCKIGSRFNSWITDICFQGAILLTILACVDFIIINLELFENHYWLELTCSFMSLMAVIAWFNVLFRHPVSKWVMFAIFIAIIVTFLTCLKSLMLCIATYGTSRSLLVLIVFIVATVFFSFMTVKTSC